MIISEKQVHELMEIAQWHINLVRVFYEDEDNEGLKRTVNLIYKIKSQQSEKLKVIE